MNTPVHADLQHESPFLIECGSDIFAYLHQLTVDYPPQNIRFFDTKGQDEDIVSLLPFGSIYPKQGVNDQETNVDYFTILQELKSSDAPRKWALIDCNDIKFVGLCDLVFTVFRVLQDDFDITIPSCQPNGNLCLIGFGESLVPSTPQNSVMYKSTMVTHFLEKMVRIMLLCSDLKFDLTARELECIGWVGRGKTSGEIGTILSISESTVDKHVTAVCQKLDAVNRMQMIAKAVRLGLI